MTDKVGISVNTLRQIVQGRPYTEQTRHISSDELITYTVNRGEADAISEALRIAASIVHCRYCKHWHDDESNGVGECSKSVRKYTTAKFYCADGER